MQRTIFTALLITTATTAPAHDDMALDGLVHRCLHYLGTETVVMLAGGAVTVLAVALVRRCLRGAAHRHAER